MFNPCRDHCLIYRGRSYKNDCDKTCDYAMAIRELQHNEFNVYDMLKRIKSHHMPPWDDNDIYFNREPWKHFGVISSGIVMDWYWFRDDVILQEASIKEIVQAYREILDYEQNGSK